MVSDKTLAREAAEGGLAEVKLGRLAEQNGESQAAKGFGRRLVEDHSKANDELKSAASQDNLTFPDQLCAKCQATRDELSKLNGAASTRAMRATW
jgi:putative membrane protein